MMCWLRKAALFIGTTMAAATLSVLEAYAGTFAARAICITSEHGVRREGTSDMG